MVTHRVRPGKYGTSLATKHFTMMSEVAILGHEPLAYLAIVGGDDVVKFGSVGHLGARADDELMGNHLCTYISSFQQETFFQMGGSFYADV